MMKILMFLCSLMLLISSSGCDLVLGDAVSVTLAWTAPGDDGDVGTCDRYDLRWATDSTALIDDFTSQQGGPLPMVPQESGSTESYTVTGLDSESVYFFAVKAADEAGNWSPLSNVISVLTPDDEAPVQITDLRLQ